MIKVNNILKVEGQKHFRLEVVWGERESLSLPHFERVSEEVVERERGIREGRCDYNLKITVAVSESPVYRIQRWNINAA